MVSVHDLTKRHHRPDCFSYHRMWESEPEGIRIFSEEFIMSQVGRYTEEARQALLASREEALQLRHRVIGPEHIVLGILKAGDPIIECVLQRRQVSTARLRESLEFVVGRGSRAIISQPTFGQPAREALERAGQVAVFMGQEQIGVEHLLLGVLSDETSVASGVLESLGLS